MFNNAEYPFEWSLGYVDPIFKGDDPSNTAELRNCEIVGTRTNTSI